VDVNEWMINNIQVVGSLAPVLDILAETQTPQPGELKPAGQIDAPRHTHHRKLDSRDLPPHAINKLSIDAG
jgi:hypothetical protein